MVHCFTLQILILNFVGTQDKPHAIQAKIAESHAVQCGFDTPGIVCSMFALLLNNKQPSMTEVERSLIGNISRCNGYRAVLEGFKAFTTCSTNEREKFEPTLPNLHHEILEPITFNGKGVTWYSVPSMAWLKTLQIKHPDALVVYGIPDNKDLVGASTVLDVSRVEHLKKDSRGHYEISANVTITEFIQKLKEITSQSNSCVLLEAVCALETTKTAKR